MQRIALLSSLVLLAATLPAQAPPPAAELDKFSTLLGNWAGSGTMKETPDGETATWTGTISFKKVLGGHYVREEGAISAPGMPGPYLFKNHHGWSRENKRYELYGVDNMGQITESIGAWDGDSLVTSHAFNVEGNRVFERWTTKVGDSGWSVVCHRAVGAGPFFTHIEGKFKTADAKPKAIEASFAAAAPSAELGKWKGILGHYDVKGWVIMPGAPKMDIWGDEKIVSSYGGTIIERFVNGQPGDYESWSATGWSAERNCYVSVGLSSMGEGSVVDGRFVGNDIVFMHAKPMMGQPMAQRVIMHCDDSGKFTKMTGHTIAGTEAPKHTFEATYTNKN